ncbi:hypothetical protein AAHC03_020707 [Spirometra sp. Aus1]
MISKAGIAFTDPRLSSFMAALRNMSDSRREREHSDTLHGLKMDKDEFFQVTQGDLSMLLRVAVNDFCIPDFPAFKERIKQLYEQCSSCSQGQVANYIPQLAKVDPNLWAVSICTVDGQRQVSSPNHALLNAGKSNERLMQSARSVFTYFKIY